MSRNESIGIEVPQRIGQRLRGRRREERARLTVDDRLERAAGRVGERRPAGGGGFQGDKPEIFFAGEDRRARRTDERVAHCIVDRTVKGGLRSVCERA